MATKEREKDFQTTADEYGRRVVAGMREELDALNHANECDGEANCEHCEGGTLFGDCGRCNGTGLIKCAMGGGTDNPESWHDEDAARERIYESPLSLEVRSGWYTPGSEQDAPEEYKILLGTGGPASRIVGKLSQYGDVLTAAFEYQDWFKPWTEARLSSEEESTLLEWAQVFSFETGR